MSGGTLEAFDARLWRLLDDEVATCGPLVAPLDGERRREPEEAVFVGEDADDARPTAHLGMIVFDGVGRAEPAASFGLGEDVACQHLADRRFEPRGELGARAAKAATSVRARLSASARVGAAHTLRSPVRSSVRSSCSSVGLVTLLTAFRR